MKVLFASVLALLSFSTLFAHGSAGATPKWTADGRQIVFVDGPYPEGREVFIMNADGTGRRQLTSNNLGHEYPTLSPDGKTILFTSYRTGNWRFYVMNADGTGERDLGMAPTGTDLNDPSRPDWSPDGKQFAFPLTRDGKRFLHVADADGTNVREIPNGSGLYPHWSRDGKALAFFASNNLHTINLDGTDRRQLTQNPTDAQTRPNYPQWSADGREIFYLHGDDLFRMNADGSNATKLPNIPPGMKWYLGVSTQGRLVYCSQENKVDKLYTLNPDGTDLQRVTN